MSRVQLAARTRASYERWEQLEPSLTNITLKVWRQDGPGDAGRFETSTVSEISEEASFLELLDVLNERLIDEGKDAIVFDHDCREGICGTCSLMIDGQAHGPQRGTATCQLHMRKFPSGDEIVVEPWRAPGVPDHQGPDGRPAAFDRIVEVGGFITAETGGAPDANLIPIPKPVADAAMDAAECIGCGACVAACPNGAANLFTGAKVAHLNLLPQGQAERYSRVEAMVETMDEHFGSCTNHGECEAACPKEHLDRRDRADERRLPQVQVQEPQVPQPHLTVRPDQRSRRSGGIGGDVTDDVGDRLVEACEEAIAVGDRGRVGGDAEVDGRAIAEEGDVDRGAGRGTVRDEVVHLHAHEVEGEVGARHVRGEHVDALHHPTDDEPGCRHAEPLDGCGYGVDVWEAWLGPQPFDLVAHLAEPVAVTVLAARGGTVSEIRAGTNWLPARVAVRALRMLTGMCTLRRSQATP